MQNSVKGSLYSETTCMPPKQGKLASVCLQQYSSIFETPVVVYQL